MVCIFDPACELLPPSTKELYGTCVLLALPLYCTFSLTSPLPTFPMYSIYRQCVNVRGWWGGNEMYCGPYSVFHILTRLRTYKIASPPQTKMTSKDDIKGLVSLKFLRPCFPPYSWICRYMSHALTHPSWQSRVKGDIVNNIVSKACTL